MVTKNGVFRSHLVWLLGSIALLLSGGFSLCAQEVQEVGPLRWKFAADQQRYYRWSQSTSLEVDLGATGKVQTVAEQTIDFSWRVEQIRSDGSAVLVQKIERIQWEVTGPNKQSAQIDSSAVELPIGFGAMLAPLVRELIDQPVTLILSARGEIKSLEADASLLETIRSSPGSKMLSDLAAETILKNLARSTSLLLPETKNLQRNQQWTDTTELTQPLLGKMQLETTFRYEGPRLVNQRPLERFALTRLASFDNKEKMQIIEQKSSGHLLFDREEGWMESSETKHELFLQSLMDKHETPVTLRQETKVTTQLAGK